MEHTAVFDEEWLQWAMNDIHVKAMAILKEATDKDGNIDWNHVNDIKEKATNNTRFVSDPKLARSLCESADEKELEIAFHDWNRNGGLVYAQSDAMIKMAKIHKALASEIYYNRLSRCILQIHHTNK